MTLAIKWDLGRSGWPRNANKQLTLPLACWRKLRVEDVMAVIARNINGQAFSDPRDRHLLDSISISFVPALLL